MKLFIRNIFGLLAALTSGMLLANSQGDFSVSGEASAGFIHNSALSVDEIDSVSNEGDSGNEIGFKLNAQWQASDKFKMAGGYSYQQQNFNKFSQFDLALHQVNLDTSYQLNKGEVGLRLDSAKAKLAQSTFLDFQQASVYYGLFLQPQTYMRTSFKVKDKTFAELSSRDAEGMGASADIFHFTNSANTMLMIGLNIEKEDATNEEFSFNGLGFNTKVSHKFTVFGLGSQVGLNWRYQKKDYTTPQSTEFDSQDVVERDENRQVVTASWSINLLDSLALQTELEHGDYSSELESLTYQQTVASVGISYKW